MKPNKTTAILFSFFTLYGAFAHQAASRDVAPPFNVYDRPSVSLDGQWHVIIDPMETGYYDYRREPKSDGFFKNKKRSNKTELLEYDFDAGNRLHVPGDWNSQQAELLWYEGVVWYKKDFTCRKKPGKRLFLHFGAVNYDAKVYLNGHKLGEHTGGFTPFGFEITDIVNDGNNFVVVKVDNTRHPDAIPAMNSDWWNYGGITRSVSLIETPHAFIQDYFIQPDKGKSRQIKGYVRLAGTNRRQRVTISIPELKFSRSFVTDTTGYAAVEFSQTFERWSPENPKRYDVQITSGNDSVADRIGFRTIETRGQDILLNGQSVFLRGICIHEETPFRPGRAHSAEDARTLLGWAKELGCNFVRLAHYPHNEHMIREADRMGMLLWSEIPLYWTIRWENPAVLPNAEKQFREMFHRDKNRAAVILWSLANETPRSDARLKFLSSLARYIRTLDSTRLLTAALETHREKNSPDTILINDPLGEHLDVLGCNEYFGWYNGSPDNTRNLVWKATCNKPLIMSEFGAGALYGKHGDRSERWTEEYQQHFFEENLHMLQKIPFLRGATPWILMDFRSPKRPLANIQDYYNRKGIISERGNKKKAFYIIQSFYNELKNND
jgi:beta-glucuronidase